MFVIICNVLENEMLLIINFFCHIIYSYQLKSNQNITSIHLYFLWTIYNAKWTSLSLIWWIVILTMKEATDVHWTWPLAKMPWENRWEQRSNLKTGFTSQCTDLVSLWPYKLFTWFTCLQITWNNAMNNSKSQVLFPYLWPTSSILCLKPYNKDEEELVAAICALLVANEVFQLKMNRSDFGEGGHLKTNIWYAAICQADGSAAERAIFS